jgi:prepilin-type N-terminal cleavage/methylation domain-containing protein
MKTSANQQGFTVVELIATITVMAILGVIGFISMTGYLESSRDSVRLTDMNSIYDQLNLSLWSNSTLPLPEDYRTITFGGKVITYQWYAKKATMNSIKFEKGGKDPKDGTYYTYTIDRKKKQAQLTGYFEDYDTTKLSLDTSGSPSAYTIKSWVYTGRKVGTIGRFLGTLLESGSLMPIQATSTGTLEVSNTMTPYVVYFNSTTTASGTGATLSGAFTSYSAAWPF